MTTSLEIVSQPTSEPLTLEEIKSHLRVTDDEENGLIQIYATAAREYVESISGIVLLTTVMRYNLDAFSDVIYIPVEPIQSVINIQYYNEYGILITYPSSNYYVDLVSSLKRITFVTNANKPTLQPNRTNAVQVNFVAGYSSVNAIPKRLKLAVIMLTADFFEHREDSIETRLEKLPTGVKSLIRSSRRGFYR